MRLVRMPSSPVKVRTPRGHGDGMCRQSALALGLLAATVLVLRNLAGCSTSNAAGSPDAGEEATATDAEEASVDAGDGGIVVGPCNGGCLCYGVDKCPTGPNGCYVSQIVQPDGSSSPPFCSNGIEHCVLGGGAWSLGETNTCLSPNPSVPDFPVTYVDGGPDGAFCCDIEHKFALIGDATADTGE